MHNAIVFGGPLRAFTFNRVFYKCINILHLIALRQQVQVKNPYLDTMEEDILYHFSLSTKTHNLPEMFGDIKVCKVRPD